MGEIFNEIIYRPLFNLLVWLYNLSFSDLGIAIILLTVVVRIILFPLFHKSLKHQRLLQELQPQIRKIQETHKNDKEKQTKAIMDFYKTNKVNPFTPILLLLVQIPVLIALYNVFVRGLSEASLKALYPFVGVPAVLNHQFLGLINLSGHSLLITALATALQFIQGKLSLPASKKGDELSAGDKASRQMIYFMPVITIIFLVNLPAAIGLYWLSTTLFSIIQQIIVNREFRHE